MILWNYCFIIRLWTYWKSNEELFPYTILFLFFMGIFFNTWFGNRIFKGFTMKCYHQGKTAAAFYTHQPNCQELNWNWGQHGVCSFQAHLFSSTHLQILISDFNHSDDFRNTMEAEQNWVFPTVRSGEKNGIFSWYLAWSLNIINKSIHVLVPKSSAYCKGSMSGDRRAGAGCWWVWGNVLVHRDTL